MSVDISNPLATKLPNLKAAITKITQSPKLVGTLGRIKGVNTVLGPSDTAANGAVEILTRSVHRTGKYGATNIQLVYDNIRLNGSATYNMGENITATQGSASYGTMTCSAAIELADTTVIQCSFNNQATTSVDLPFNGGQSITDPVSIYIPPDTEFYVRTWNRVAANTITLSAAQTVSSGAVSGKQIARQGAGGASLSTLFLASGQPSSNSTVVTSKQQPPTAIIGLTTGRGMSLVYAGDSIGDGTGDVATDMTHGETSFIGRSTVNVNGYNIPHIKMTRGGETVVALAKDSTGWRRANYFKYGSHFLMHIGTNDIVAGSTLGTIQAAFQVVWAKAKANGLYVMQTSILPRVSVPTGTYTQSGTTTVTVTRTSHGLTNGNTYWVAPTSGTGTSKAAVVTVVDANTFTYVADTSLTTSGAINIFSSQTPYTNFEGNGTSIRDQLNLWFPAQVTAGNLDQYIDLRSEVEDTSGAPGVWKNIATGVTDDGVHPNSFVHINLSTNILKPVLATLEGQM
jgi:hypothetical protein